MSPITGLLPGRPTESLRPRLHRDRPDPVGRTSQIHRNPRTTSAAARARHDELDRHAGAVGSDRADGDASRSHPCDGELERLDGQRRGQRLQRLSRQRFAAAGFRERPGYELHRPGDGELDARVHGRCDRRCRQPFSAVVLGEPGRRRRVHDEHDERLLRHGVSDVSDRAGCADHRAVHGDGDGGDDVAAPRAVPSNCTGAFLRG